MTSIHMIITALATACTAKESIECSFSEAIEVQTCSGAVGQLLIFHLPNTANIRLKKDKKSMVLKTEPKGKATFYSGYTNHAELFENGTFILGNAMKNHSGNYELEEYGSNGKFLKRMNLNLEVQAPVSKPALSQACLSPQQMDISCSSRGEDPDFNVTLDGELLVQREQQHILYGTAADIKSLKWTKNQENQHNVTTVTISLHGQLEGNLTCCVWNKISREESVIHLNSCKVEKSEEETPATVNFVTPIPFPVVAVAVIASFLALLLVVLGCGFTVLKRTPSPPAVDEGSLPSLAIPDDPEEEIIYTDVKVVQIKRPTEPDADQISTELPTQPESSQTV